MPVRKQRNTRLPVVTSKEGENQGLLRAAGLMMVSCRTAPKSGGVDDIETVLVTGEEKDKIAAQMDNIGNGRGIDGFKRDADNVKRSEAILLVGVNGRKSFSLSCGACGHATCQEFDAAAQVSGLDFEGPTCVFKALGLGIALGSAVKTASDLNVDNRIMYRAGTAAKLLGYLSGSSVVMGIPISASGKSIYFDRKWPK
jgi:uncharacterized ferredoxin-like protein